MQNPTVTVPLTPERKLAYGCRLSLLCWKFAERTSVSRRVYASGMAARAETWRGDTVAGYPGALPVAGGLRRPRGLGDARRTARHILLTRDPGRQFCVARSARSPPICPSTTTTLRTACFPPEPIKTARVGETAAVHSSKLRATMLTVTAEYSYSKNTNGIAN